MILIYLFKILTFINLINFSKSAIRFHNDSIIIPSRSRRYLIFENGGVAKMAFGATYPVNTEDPIKWRQLNCAYNIQPQYAVPTVPTYPWDKWEGRSHQMKKEENFSSYGKYLPDESRKLVYIALETFMNNRGKKGRKCLLRAICENTQIDDHHGIFSEILHAILTPGKENLDDEYRDAFQAGTAGIDCLHLYPECPKGDSFVDSISVLI